MDHQVAWFCYHIVTEKLVTAEQCRQLAKAFAEVGQAPVLEAFAQAVLDNGFCTNAGRLEKLGNLAMQEADTLGAPPEDIFASASTGRPRVALRKPDPAGRSVSVPPGLGEQSAQGETPAESVWNAVVPPRQSSDASRFHRKYKCCSCGNTGTVGIEANACQRFPCCRCGADLFADFGTVSPAGAFLLADSLEIDLAQEQREGRTTFHCPACSRGVPVGIDHCPHCGLEGPTGLEVARIMAERMPPVDAMPAAEARKRITAAKGHAAGATTTHNLLAALCLGMGFASLGSWWSGTEGDGAGWPLWPGIVLLIAASWFRSNATSNQSAGWDCDKILKDLDGAED